MTSYSSRLAHSTLTTPDHYSGGKPNPDFVISRGKNGLVLSRYKDTYWNLRPYAKPNQRDFIIYFDIDLGNSTNAYVDEIKIILILMMFVVKGRRSHVSTTTFKQYAQTLKVIAAFCAQVDIPISSALTSKHYAELFLSVTSKENRVRFGTMLRLLLTCPADTTNLTFIDPSTLKNFRTSKQAINDKKQTSIIPQRIFTKCLEKLNNLISEYLDNKSNIEQLTDKLIKDTAYGRSQQQQRAHNVRAGQYRPSFKEAVKLHNLCSVSKNHKIFSVAQLAKYLSTIQFCCKTIVHAFSGMRDGEVYSIKYNPLATRKFGNLSTLRLIGVTTKFEAGNGRITYWITSEEILPAILAAQSICRMISKQLNKPAKKLNLFTTTSHLSFSIANHKTDVDDLINSNLKHSVFNSIVFHEAQFKISKDDIRELKKIDFSRAWDDEPRFKEGNYWPFATHQFRRSLAVYALSSRLVSITSLKRQLQHISLSMTLYYVRGLLSNLSLFGSDKDHMAFEVQEIKKTVEALDYLETHRINETLLGTHGKHIENSIKPFGEEKILENRDETIRRAKRGELHFHSTPLGGCTSSHPCTKKFHKPLTCCIGCSKPIIIPSVAKDSIKKQMVYIESMPEGPEKNTELSEINELTKYLTRNGQ